MRQTTPRPNLSLYASRYLDMRHCSRPKPGNVCRNARHQRRMVVDSPGRTHSKLTLEVSTTGQVRLILHPEAKIATGRVYGGVRRIKITRQRRWLLALKERFVHLGDEPQR